MRFIEGDSLKEAIERFHRTREESDATSKPPFDSLEFRQLLRSFVDVCNAIAYAHSRGVLHRDLKPANVMLGQYGETLIIDWGLAKATGRSDPRRTESGGTPLLPTSGSSIEQTEAGIAMGTPAYMSPEQAWGRIDELGPATDLYSLGTHSLPSSQAARRLRAGMSSRSCRAFDLAPSIRHGRSWRTCPGLSRPSA